jgi:capsule polysaccharide export protein KpsE/RkpR
VAGELGELLSAALAIITIATLTGAGLMRGTVIDLREKLVDADAEVARIKAARAEDNAEHAEFKAKADALITQLQADHSALARVVTGEAHLVAILDLLEEAIRLLTELKDGGP